MVQFNGNRGWEAEVETGGVVEVEVEEAAFSMVTEQLLGLYRSGICTEKVVIIPSWPWNHALSVQLYPNRGRGDACRDGDQVGAV